MSGIMPLPEAWVGNVLCLECRDEGREALAVAVEEQDLFEDDGPFLAPLCANHAEASVMSQGFLDCLQ